MSEWVSEWVKAIRISTSSGAELACSKQRAEYGYVVYAGVAEVYIAESVGYFETFGVFTVMRS